MTTPVFNQTGLRLWCLGSSIFINLPSLWCHTLLTRITPMMHGIRLSMYIHDAWKIQISWRNLQDHKVCKIRLKSLFELEKGTNSLPSKKRFSLHSLKYRTLSRHYHVIWSFTSHCGTSQAHRAATRMWISKFLNKSHIKKGFSNNTHQKKNKNKTFLQNH